MLLSLQIYAQGEANVWYFGNRAGLNFNSGSPVVIRNGRLNTLEGCATQSNSAGQLLFYTDGATVWNKNHQIMSNGTGLLGSGSSSQAAIIVPKPNSTTIYYIFTSDDYEHDNKEGIHYSEVDLSLNGGLGDVTYIKNIVLYKPACEKMTAVKNANGDGYWIVTHALGNNDFLAYSVTSNGLNLSPIVSSIGSLINSSDETLGYIKFSPDGTKLISCNNRINAELFDFDALTGSITNPRFVNLRSSNYGVEFSPSGNIAYISTWDDDLFQYDLTATDIPSTEIVLRSTESQFDRLGALQLATDGKIYIANFGTYYLCMINNPEVLGLGCGFQYNKINLGSGISYLGLPQFIQSYFITSITAQNLCLGSNTQFKLNSTSTPTSISWNFGDGVTSTAINPSHQYSKAGTYTVSISATSVSGKTNSSKQITISGVAVVANSINSQSVCGNANMSYDLSQFNNTLLGGQSTSSFGVAYFSSMATATNHTNVLSNNQNLSLGATTFYAKIYNLNNTSCHAITNFTVTLSQNPTANTPTDYVICENLPYDNVEQFNLSTKNTSVLGIQNTSEFTITYHGSLIDANNDINPLPFLYTNTLPKETLYVRIENKSNSGCFVTTSLKIQVIQQPLIAMITNYKICDDTTNDGIASFDLKTKTAEILNGQSSTVFEVKYYFNRADAQDNTNEILIPISNTINNQDIYYTISAIGNSNCKVSSSFKLVVSQLPMVQKTNSIFNCDDATNDGTEIFNLQNNNNTILGMQNPSQFAVSYHISQNEANTNSSPLPINYQNTTNPQTIFARLENNQNPTCFATTSFQIGLYKFPMANQPQNLFVCDDASNDGVETFDLSLQNSNVMGTQPTNDFTISYHSSQTDANAGIYPLPTICQNTANPQTIYVRMTNNVSAGCFSTTSFQLIVKKKPELNMKDSYSICEGKSIKITAPNGFSSYSWSNGTIKPSSTIDKAGNYSVTVTKDYGAITCETTADIVIYNSNSATITKIETLDWSDTENNIKVYATGDGDYEYSIDGVFYQDGPQFSGLNNGQYTIYVRDKKGCGIKTEEVFLLMYPKFFTPNGDTYNDTWHIQFSEMESNMKVVIYDRYGKLIIGYKGTDFGWDGNLNGELLPSDDYWFVVQRQNGMEYKGHFALKR